MFPKNKLKLSTFLLLVILTFAFLPKSYSQEDKNLYQKGIRAARKGNRDIAFINFHMLLNNFPESGHREQVLFAIGEYYFSIDNLNEAIKTFNQLINDYPDSAARPFATVYLLELSKKIKDKTTTEKLTKELITSQQVSLLFRDCKEVQYLSSLNKNYKVISFVDKIEFHVDEKIFLEISF